MSLISYNQIDGNLRRTARLGLISLLNQKQFIDLSVKYFGKKDEYGNILEYTCPYSGKTITNYNEIVLEHIIPVSSGGGTVLFNCIPTSEEVNKFGEKGKDNLIAWWTNSKYWDESAPKRLEKLVNYILEAYDIVFEENTIEEVEQSYQNIDIYDDYFEYDNSYDDDELEKGSEDFLQERQEQISESKDNGIESYLGFLLNCIETLEKNNIDITEIKDKLKKLEEKNIFKEIEKYQLYQNTIQELIKSKLNIDNNRYLSYSQNLNIKKLMDSINLENKEEIEEEISKRIENIENLLKQNNLVLDEYFKSLRDIQDIDIIYKNISNISKEEQDIFLENIKLGTDSKISIFIDMLNEGNSKILTQKNTETFKGYPSIKLSRFWSKHKPRVKQKLFEELKDNPEYDKARETILMYFSVNSYEELMGIQELNFDKKIIIYINMLNQGNSKILLTENEETLEGYPSVNLSQFWSNHKQKIMQKLFTELKDNPEYDKARETILMYFDVNSYEELITKQDEHKSRLELKLDIKIEIFIKMLNQGNSKILKQGNKETLEGYPSVNLSHFWNSNKRKIMQKLFAELKDNPEYDKARETVLTYLKVSNYEEYLEKEEERQKQKNNLTEAEKQFQNNQNLKIDCFIEMLNEGNKEILKQKNIETFKGYPNTNVGSFWSSNNKINQYKIMQKLFIELKDNSEYDKARETILMYFSVNNYEELRAIQELNFDKKIIIYINMLNQGNSKILKQGNKETLEGYPSVNLSDFWSNHKQKIMQKLFAELKDNPEYDKARETILMYFGVNSYEELITKQDEYKSILELELDIKIEIFIKMLNQGNSKILVTRNEETLEGYPSIKLSLFWSRHQPKIKQKLFEELKDNPEYDKARETVLTYLKARTYEELQEKETAKKELKQAKNIRDLKQMQKDLIDSSIEFSSNESRKIS